MIIGTTTGGFSQSFAYSQRLAWPMLIGGPVDLAALYYDGHLVTLKGTYGTKDPQLAWPYLLSDGTLLRTFGEDGSEIARKTLDAGKVKDLMHTERGLVALWIRPQAADGTATIAISFDGVHQNITVPPTAGTQVKFQTTMIEFDHRLYVFWKRDGYHSLGRLVFDNRQLVANDQTYIGKSALLNAPEGEFPSLAASAYGGRLYLAYQSNEFKIWQASGPFKKGAKIAIAADVDKPVPTFLPRSQHYAERVNAIALVGLDLIYPRMDSALDDGQTLIRESGGSWTWRKPLYHGLGEWGLVTAAGEIMVSP